MTFRPRCRSRASKDAEVHADHDGDEDPEQSKELALLQQVGLAGLPDELGDLPHRPVGRQPAHPEEDDETEDQTQCADDQSERKQVAAADAVEADRSSGRAAPGSPRPRVPSAASAAGAKPSREAASTRQEERESPPPTASRLRVVYIPCSNASFSSKVSRTGRAPLAPARKAPPSRARPNRSLYRSAAPGSRNGRTAFDPVAEPRGRLPRTARRARPSAARRAGSARLG